MGSVFKTSTNIDLKVWQGASAEPYKSEKMAFIQIQQKEAQLPQMIRILMVKRAPSFSHSKQCVSDVFLILWLKFVGYEGVETSKM